MRVILALAAASATLAGCTTYDDRRGGYRYEGSAWNQHNAQGRNVGRLHGPGIDLLDPWLADTEEGSVVVRAGWAGARAGYVDERTAERANAWFRRYADEDRDLCLTDAEIRAALVWAARDVRLGLAHRHG